MDDLFNFAGGHETLAATSKKRKGRKDTKKGDKTSEPISESKPAPELEPEPESNADAARASSEHGSSDEEEDNSGEDGLRRSRKKRKKGEPYPLVLDDIQIEANREVRAHPGLVQSQADVGENLLLTHQVRHQVAVPPGYPYVPLSQHVPPAEPARIYPFKLDPFQQVSIHAIERNESVLVSAHTSAGKTVVAEYAIAHALRNKQRVIYTSPIKALSNQKYREMLAEFGDVGLVTGDVTISPSASCLVMTTEILRSMLYRGSEIVREVAWVVFDEIHYMRDRERGVVWEETLILLPHTVRHVFLSATIPNAMQFAEWVCDVHEQPCHVVYTDFRPTPLQHYLFPMGGDGIYLVVNERSEFKEGNFNKAMARVSEGKGEDPSNPFAGRGNKGRVKTGSSDKGSVDIVKLVKMIMLKNYHPVIVFAFNKSICESLAMTMTKIDFNTSDEQEMVNKIYTNAISALSEEDQKLPQIEHLLPLLKRGIGIHHSGLLPILKEVIEILFQEGLVKLLFATETFSIGLNMPARTVVFYSVMKFDGKAQRPLSGGEYIQMSGRAGRRGIDDRGIVIMMCDGTVTSEATLNMVKGGADPLNSAFHIGYNMILNLMRVEGISPEYMLERCFYQFQSQADLPNIQKKLELMQEKKDAIVVPEEEKVADYWEVRHRLEELNLDLRDIITHPNYIEPFLNVGRLIRIQHGDLDFGWGVILKYAKRTPADKSRGYALPDEFESKPQNQYILDVLLNCSRGSSLPLEKVAPEQVPRGVQPCPQGEKGEPLVVPVMLSTLQEISALRLHVPKDLRPLEARQTLWRSVLEVKKRFPQAIPLLDPITNMKISDDLFVDLTKKIASLESRLKSNPISEDPRLPLMYDLYSTKQRATEEIKGLKRKIRSVNSVLQMDELKCRKRVLRRLQFITADDIVETKGRVACEINSGDELLLTEMIFNGVFNSLAPEHCAALLSCFVFDDTIDQAVKLREEYQAPLRQMQELAKRIVQVSKESKIDIDENTYLKSFKVDIMDCVTQWCRGASFVDTCAIADVFEGSMIRIFRRLAELVREMAAASRAIGNAELEKKFTQATEMLERRNSVIFCASLYL
ncbi:antiviral helicase [Cantharellus anzutake]|uniref:antiviral helicase n=1 Tax=Cantharellus anzutake TaxID=1750568 RepID=UPI001907FF7F|nr:antiviral helicase [Cantharellus anzutake]KAF8343118.1 antiviral helicase [Cantharellus anzutake]